MSQQGEPPLGDDTRGRGDDIVPGMRRTDEGLQLEGSLELHDNSMVIGVVHLHAARGDPIAQRWLATYESQSRHALVARMASLCEAYHRHSLLQEVATAYEKPLSMPVDLSWAPHLVDQRNLRPWEKRPRAIASATTIEEIARQADGLLVVAGAAGAGKSTLLVDLAARLTQHASAALAREAVCQLPILLQASTRYQALGWEGKLPRTLTEWIVKDSALWYNVPESTVSGWLDTGQLYLLIDDLNALGNTERHQFILDLNEFVGRHGVNHVVLATRSEDLTSVRPLLRLRAVEVRPPSLAAVSSSITSLGPGAARLQEAHQHSLALQTVLGTPLMVAVAALGFRNSVLDTSHTSDPTAAEDYVLSQYIERATSMTERDQQYGPRSTRYYAASLAKLLEETRSAYLLSLPDPQWIRSPRARFAATHGVRMVGALPLLIGVALVANLALGWTLAFVLALVTTISFDKALSGINIPKFSLAADTPHQERRYRLGWRRFSQSLGRMTIALVAGLAAVYSAVSYIQNRELLAGLWPAASWAVWLPIAALVVLLIGLVIERVPEKTDAFDDFGYKAKWAGQWGYLLSRIAFMELVGASLLGSIWLANGLWFNWIMGLQVVRTRMDAPHVDYSTWLGTASYQLMLYIEHCLRTAPLGHEYLQPSWPWWLALLGAGYGAIGALSFGLEAGAAVVVPRVCAALQKSIPADYAGFLHHATSVGLLRRIQGRYVFSHDLIQAYLLRKWEDSQRRPPDRDEE